jgi:hypothetical protein
MNKCSGTSSRRLVERVRRFGLSGLALPRTPRARSRSSMADLYREVRTKRFSTLIGCEFDPDTREVTRSERLTPIYRPEG